MTRGVETGSGADGEDVLLLMGTSPSHEEKVDEPQPVPRSNAMQDPQMNDALATTETKEVKPKPPLALQSLRFLLNNCKLKSGSIRSSPVVSQNDNSKENCNGVQCDSDADSTKLLNDSEKQDMNVNAPSSPVEPVEPGGDDKNSNEENSPPKRVSQRKGRKSLKDYMAVEVGNIIGEGITRRRSTRLSLSKLGNDLTNKKSKNKSPSPIFTPVSRRGVNIKLKTCFVKLYRCDYKLRVTTQFQFSHQPKKSDERNLIKSLKKLKVVLGKKLDQRKQLNQANSMNLTPPIFPSVTAPKIKLEKAKKLSKFRLAKCKHCSELYPTQFQLYKHVLKSHYEKRRPYRCGLCENKSFKLRGHLYDHLRETHTLETPFKCELFPSCREAFHKKGALVLHMRTHPSSSPDKILSGRMKQRTASATLFSCSNSKCNKTFEKYSQRQRHVKKHHLTRRPLFRCATCGKSCSSILLLKLHSLHSHALKKI